MKRLLPGWVRPSVDLLSERWDAEPYASRVGSIRNWPEIGRLRGRFREGVRSPADEFCYRPSSITDLRLTGEGLAAPQIPTVMATEPAVASGDVVLSKFLPLRAAWVSMSTPRRSIDSNCVRIIGLSREMGFWVANVLEHPVYQDLFLRGTAASVIPRLGLRDLKRLRVPQPPPEVGGWVARWSDALDGLHSALGEVKDLQSQAEELARMEMPHLVDTNAARFCSAADIPDAWLPGHVALRHFQRLVAAGGWRSLADLFSLRAERMRGRELHAVRVLRLSHADAPFGFELPNLAELNHPSFRIYADPLRPAEVLLSVLGSAPKFVFHHPSVTTSVWVADHWIRFAGGEAPGALALLLRTQPVVWQLGLAATGTARQFVTRAEIENVRVPWPPAAVGQRWHLRLCAALERIKTSKDQLAEIRSGMKALVDRALGSTQ